MQVLLLYFWKHGSNHQRSSVKIATLKNFEIFIEKQLCWSLFLIKLQLQLYEKETKHKCFPENIAKFLRTFILKNICERLFTKFWTFVTLTCAVVWYWLSKSVTVINRYKIYIDKTYKIEGKWFYIMSNE